MPGRTDRADICRKGLAQQHLTLRGRSETWRISRLDAQPFWAMGARAWAGLIHFGSSRRRHTPSGP